MAFEMYLLCSELRIKIVVLSKCEIITPAPPFAFISLCSPYLKAAVRNFFVFKIYISKYTMKPFQTVFLACPESLRYTYNKCLYSDYLVRSSSGYNILLQHLCSSVY